MSNSALFVCLGNICRSPIAEACFKQLLQEKGVLANWRVDSAATSRYEIGSSPDRRGQKCMKKHKIFHHVENHRARQITAKDYDEFDYIFGMDDSNMSNLQNMAPKKSYKAQLLLLGSFDDDKSSGGIIEDPYYGTDDEDFEVVYQQCLRSCRNFLQEKSI
ncbi:low molecular weight phosphotyrosine protein phosphatase-like [Clavelina lepadiformis]|uniref:Low molecular weight phosphotyrosine protein phosphatase n=1 Tax=Clavelina lepadiformis TaxID=159417 RepID=A0ABP0GHP6_CLALP